MEKEWLLVGFPNAILYIATLRWDVSYMAALLLVLLIIVNRDFMNYPSLV